MRKLKKNGFPAEKLISNGFDLLCVLACIMFSLSPLRRWFTFFYLCLLFSGAFERMKSMDKQRSCFFCGLLSVSGSRCAGVPFQVLFSNDGGAHRCNPVKKKIEPLIGQKPGLKKRGVRRCGLI